METQSNEGQGTSKARIKNQEPCLPEGRQESRLMQVDDMHVK